MNAEELRALLEAATPLPWSWRKSDLYWEAHINGGIATTYVTDTEAESGADAYEIQNHNAALIVAAVNALPDLLAVVEAAFIQDSERWHCLICGGWDGQHQRNDRFRGDCPVAQLDPNPVNEKSGTPE